MTEVQVKKSFNVDKALKQALGGGLSGASAMVVQVATLMPLRTTMNYQYRYGTSTTEALKTLFKDGGIKRFYSGVGPALIQGPLSRFGDTAANAGIMAFLDSNETASKLPVAVKTIGASVASACFRMVLTPVDTLKTTLQTQGKAGLPILKARIAANGVSSLWYGSVATGK
ncbi:mitochondrial ornithine transporter [Acrasis kona]|uniref:1 TM domain-containing transmembrane protein n=1 Tax=Acrasis kona TaxID=1008807 RepID=A0AAW2Z2A8_9EUKA